MRHILNDEIRMTNDERSPNNEEVTLQSVVI
jgi:hypothetical protein